MTELPESSALNGKVVASLTGVKCPSGAVSAVRVTFTDGSTIEVYATNCSGEIDYVVTAEALVNVPGDAPWDGLMPESEARQVEALKRLLPTETTVLDFPVKPQK